MMMCARPIWRNLKTLQEIKRKTENRKADHVHGQEDSISQKKKKKTVILSQIKEIQEK